MKKQASKINKDSKKQHNRKTARVTILSETERNYLKDEKSVFSKNPEINKVMKSKFHKELDKRFEYLFKDLEIIHRSKKLKLWKSYRAYRFNIFLRDVNYFQSLFFDVHPLFVSGIRRKRISKGKYKYWLDHSPLNDTRIDERAINPEHLFRRIRDLDENSKEILLKAYNSQGILPTIQSEAITLKEIHDRLNGKSTIRSNVKQITKEEFYKETDPRNREIDKVINRYYKKMNKKLVALDSKIVRFLVVPDYHGSVE